MSMNGTARPMNWKHMATQFLCNVYAPYNNGYIFVAARNADTRLWIEIAIRVGNIEAGVASFLKTFSRWKYDLYYCPNAFKKKARKAEFAAPTPYAWCDIDLGSPQNFPKANVLIETSPGRFQALWFYAHFAEVAAAEAHSKALTYKHGGDRSGWSITKYLRIPYTINHKPEYDLPHIILRSCNWQPILTMPMSRVTQEPTEVRSSVRDLNIGNLEPCRAVITRYRSVIHPRVRTLARSKSTAGERDRSKCIYEIIAGFHGAGASPQEIASVLWPNPYFRSKHGANFTHLTAEIRRIVSKLETRS